LSSAVQSLLTTGACGQLAAWRRQAPPPDLPEGVETLDVAMAEDVVAGAERAVLGSR
jgi:hypothetical protein